jgi:hypothetical protein
MVKRSRACLADRRVVAAAACRSLMSIPT